MVEGWVLKKHARRNLRATFSCVAEIIPYVSGMVACFCVQSRALCSTTHLVTQGHRHSLRFPSTPSSTAGWQASFFFIWTNFDPPPPVLLYGSGCRGYLSSLYLAAADKRFLPYSGMMASNVVPVFDWAVHRRPPPPPSL